MWTAIVVLFLLFLLVCNSLGKMEQRLKDHIKSQQDDLDHMSNTLSNMVKDLPGLIEELNGFSRDHAKFQKAVTDEIARMSNISTKHELSVTLYALASLVAEGELKQALMLHATELAAQVKTTPQVQ